MFFVPAKSYGPYIHQIFKDCEKSQGLAVSETLGKTDKEGLSERGEEKILTPPISGGLAQLVALLIASTKLINTRPG